MQTHGDFTASLTLYGGNYLEFTVDEYSIYVAQVQKSQSYAVSTIEGGNSLETYRELKTTIIRRLSGINDEMVNNAVAAAIEQIKWVRKNFSTFPYVCVGFICVDVVQCRSRSHIKNKPIQ